ncbi:hypothetical protein CFP56_008348 [Quercus suber]|uniref:Uncharacterized protein n=1 Tax=Quercus suber TaxID=58331 RepID=A0AAW0L6R8_QUESU
MMASPLGIRIPYCLARSLCRGFHITFRGTIIERDTVLRDINLNLRCFFNKLHKTPCFEVAMDCVVDLCKGANSVFKIALTGLSIALNDAQAHDPFVKLSPWGSIPSAYLIINGGQFLDDDKGQHFRTFHELQQWWKCFACESTCPYS